MGTLPFLESTSSRLVGSSPEEAVAQLSISPLTRTALSSPLERRYEAATNRTRRFITSCFEDVEVLPVSSPDYPGRLPQETFDFIKGNRSKTRSRRGTSSAVLLSDQQLEEPWRVVWRVRIPPPQQNGRSVEGDWDLLVAIPHTFPDKLPKIYLPHDEYQRIGTIPHVDHQRNVCALDASQITLTPDGHPGPTVSHLLEKARDVLSDGLSGTNARDFLEEFHAYWQDDAAGTALSLVKADIRSREVALLRIQRQVGDPRPSYLFADDEEQGRTWLHAQSLTAKSILKALYLPLDGLGQPPFPVNNGELWERVNRYSPAHVDGLTHFLADPKHRRPTPVLFSIPINTCPDEPQRALGSWWHPTFSIQNMQQGEARELEGVIPGYRPSCDAVIRELSQLHHHKAIVRMGIESVNPERLHVRTVGIPVSTYKGHVNIVGCGSLGSFAAETMARSGALREFKAFDPDVLSYENIQRHFCPMSLVGLFKTQAFVTELGRHFPHIRGHSDPRNILEVLRHKPETLNDAAFSLVAIGNLTIELQLNQLALHDAGNFNNPLCYIWVEPYGWAGHAIWVPPRSLDEQEEERLESERQLSRACLECAFGEDLRFKYRLIEAPSNFSVREAGCQTTHVRYGGVDLAAFNAALGRFLLMAPELKETTLWSWYGDIGAAQNAGVALRDGVDLTPFSSRTVTLSPDPCCLACGIVHHLQ